MLKPKTAFAKQYKLIKSIDVRGLAEIWEAAFIDGHLNKTVALKIYPKLQQAEVSAFEDVFKLQLKVDHTNLLPAQYLSIYKNRPYLQMHFCNNGDIGTKFRELNEPDIAKCLYQIASALACLHNNSIIHGCIKPGNILMDNGNFYCYLPDLGIDTNLRQTIEKSFISDLKDEMNDEVSLPRSFARVLLSSYCAPELFENRLNASAAADIWALGATMYEIAAGKSPFGFMGGEKQLTNDVLPDLPSHFSGELNKIIKQCLAKNKEDRPIAEEIMTLTSVMLKDAKIDFLQTNTNKESIVDVSTSETKSIDEAEKENIEAIKQIEEDFIEQQNTSLQETPNQAAEIINAKNEQEVEKKLLEELLALESAKEDVEKGLHEEISVLESDKDEQEVEKELPEEISVLESDKDEQEVEKGLPEEISVLESDKDEQEVEKELPEEISVLQSAKDEQEIKKELPEEIFALESAKEDVEKGLPEEISVLESDKDEQEVEKELPEEIFALESAKDEQEVEKELPEEIFSLVSAKNEQHVEKKLPKEFFTLESDKVEPQVEKELPEEIFPLKSSQDYVIPKRERNFPFSTVIDPTLFIDPKKNKTEKPKKSIGKIATIIALMVLVAIILAAAYVKWPAEEPAYTIKVVHEQAITKIDSANVDTSTNKIVKQSISTKKAKKIKKIGLLASFTFF